MIQVNSLAGTGGVEVLGVDLSVPGDSAEVRKLSDLFEENGLLVFRNQKLTKRQLVAAGDRFGGAAVHPLVARDPEAPGISVLSNRGYDGSVIPEDPDALVLEAPWHTDQGYLPAPNRGKILYAVQVPEEGGLTGFVDGYAAYASLPEDLRTRIEGKHVIQSWNKLKISKGGGKYRLNGENEIVPNRFPDVWYPIVYQHPVSGIKVLNFPPMWATGIAEIPGADGDALTRELLERITAPELQYWHRYEPGDAVLWDNWRFLHKAGGTPGRFARTLWSITLKSGPEIGRIPLSAAVQS